MFSFSFYQKKSKHPIVKKTQIFIYFLRFSFFKLKKLSEMFLWEKSKREVKVLLLHITHTTFSGMFAKIQTCFVVIEIDATMKAHIHMTPTLSGSHIFTVTKHVMQTERNAIDQWHSIVAWTFCFYFPFVLSEKN